ncbi:hypothetical protein K2173_023751 [Erythroxylum novogranatense]|uniref:CCR4-NOT transcription complex subunit 4 n=1 Tax=Erythroxylum novogranatense TaxID=1862640 RepID=A0AAV8TPE5_9ROSI|nr:hypothetical protein K2173_023751 [Erythroxylum novogranatense]
MFSIPKLPTMSDEGEKTCPLCAEEMDLTDQQLKPCKCGYEICVWCWHQIMDMAEKDDTEGRCPACRTAYDKEKIVGMAASCERLVAEISTERRKSQKARTKPSEGRKQLSSVRVIQRNLVYIVGLPLNLADEDLLQRREYFGQYGKVLKVSMSRTTAGVIQQFPNNTCSVYITYSKEEEAVRCIQSVHGFVLDGRSLKACFGTTKYCHAWLRNVPCTNPDCLYLHEMGSQEDSFTKDEIISAYTRSRVQQIAGATSSMLRRAGSMLPPPLDDYRVNSSVSAAKPIIKNPSNNNISSVKDSPPNGNSGRSIALPAAASWGMRASNQPQVGSAYSNGLTKPKPDTASSTLALSMPVASTAQVSTLHIDIGGKATWDEECEVTNGKSEQDMLKPVKKFVNGDGQATEPEKLATTAYTTTVSSTNLSSMNDWDTIAPNMGSSIVHNVDSCTAEEDEITATDRKLQNLCSDMSTLRVDNSIRNEISGSSRSSSSLSEYTMVKSPESLGLRHSFPEQYREHLPAPAADGPVTSVDGTGDLREQFNWRTDPCSEAGDKSISEVEDIISFVNQRLKDPEVMTRAMLNSANSLHLSSHSRSYSLQQNDIVGAAGMNADPLCLENRFSDHTSLHAPTNSLLPNGYPENLIGNASGLERDLTNEEGKDITRSQSEADSIATLHAGESSIISNILSLDLDSWDDSLTSPQNLAKLLGENDRQSSSFRVPNSWKAQNTNQSRFSFARQEDSRNQAFDVDASFSAFRQLPKNHTFSQDLIESRNLYMDKLGMVNGLSSRNFESESFTNGASLFSHRLAAPGSRAPISAPPGFSVPNRAPPPGFSSHERVDQTFDGIPGNHLLDSSSFPRNSYQAPPTGNIGGSTDIEFMDPAILAVGKGRLHGGHNNPGLDMRLNFPQPMNTFENEARLLMQRSLPQHQNLSLPQSRNWITSNGHWDSWNEFQGGNNVAMAEFLRNERLGFNKFYAAGYEDSKIRMPSSGNLYSRTFQM